jgi:hypothetical protein
MAGRLADDDNPRSKECKLTCDKFRTYNAHHAMSDSNPGLRDAALDGFRFTLSKLLKLPSQTCQIESKRIAFLRLAYQAIA